MKYRYRCQLCGQIVYKSQNVRFIRYYCEVKQSFTRLYRTIK